MQQYDVFVTVKPGHRFIWRLSVFWLNAAHFGWAYIL